MYFPQFGDVPLVSHLYYTVRCQICAASLLSYLDDWYMPIHVTVPGHWVNMILSRILEVATAIGNMQRSLGEIWTCSS